MTDDEITLTKDSWTRFTAFLQDVPGTFYPKLFELEPELPRLIRGDLAEREARLFNTIDMMMVSLPEILLLRKTLATLAYTHTGYCIRHIHFGSVGQALVDTLAQWLDNDFTPAVRNAWVSAYRTLGDMVADAALYSQPMTLAESKERFFRAVMRINLGRRKNDIVQSL